MRWRNFLSEPPNSWPKVIISACTRISSGGAIKRVSGFTILPMQSGLRTAPGLQFRRSRSGKDLLRYASEPARDSLQTAVVDVVERCGIKVDLGLEPVSGFGLYAAEVPTAIDSSPMIGPYTDCHTAPRLPYRPAREDFRVHGERGCRDLVMVPHTTTTLAPEQSLWRRLRGYLDGRSFNRAMMLSPALEWPSADFFWNLVAMQLRSMRTPYLSLAVRTDAPDSVLVARVRQIFAALPQHPLATRLRFTDPLDVAAGLVSI